MDIFKAWEEIIGDNPITDDDGRQEELAEVAIKIALEHHKAVVIDDATYLVHDGSREIAYIISAATGGQEPNKDGCFYTAMVVPCEPGWALKIVEGGDFPEVITPEEAKSILNGAGQCA